MRARSVSVGITAMLLVACGNGTTGRPDAFLAAGSAEVRAERGSSCWSLAPGRGQCLDSSGPREGAGGAVLRVHRGESVTLRFDRDDEPEVLGADLDPAPVGGDDLLGLTVERRNPTSFVVDVPPGAYYLSLGTDWPQGDMAFSLRIEVV
jgi:hypothetical protein